MKNRRLAAAVLVMVAAALPAACGLQRVNAPEGRGDAALIVLLPDPEGDTTGSAVVSNSSKPASVDLEKARDYTLVGVNLPPTRVREMKESDVRRLFGDVLEALPPAPAHFTLFFRFESDELTDEGRALVPDVLLAMKNRPVPEVFIVGHTDTTGTPAGNFELGMKRAQMVQRLLLDAGLHPSAIEVASHGEAVLLVATADETYEPRNRRVEVTIR